MDNCKSDTARKKDVKYLKCVDDNCPGQWRIQEDAAASPSARTKIF